MSGEGGTVQSEMTDVRALGVPMRVVAAKKPGHWIVRAIGTFEDMPTLRRAVERYVGTLDPELEWTTHRYEGLPSYVAYGSGDIPACQWPKGVYRFDHQGYDYEGYRSEAVKLGDIVEHTGRAQ